MTQIVEAIFSMVGNQKDQMPNEDKGFQFEIVKTITIKAMRIGKVRS